MSCLQALDPRRWESRIAEKGSEPLYSSIDLGTLRREGSNCRFTMEGPTLLASTLDRTFECNMGYYKANPRRLQMGSYHSDYGWDRNRPTTTQGVQTRRRGDRGFRGCSSSQITRSYPCLSQNQLGSHPFTQPILGRNELE